MNFVEVFGSTKHKREITHKVVAWYLKKIMPRYRTLEIDVKLTKCMNNGAYGYCMMGETNREFEIEVDKDLRLFDFVSTLCHELTHLKQYAKGEMKQLECGRVRWKKVVYPENVTYDDSPWEKEAFKLEQKLAVECFEEVL